MDSNGGRDNNPQGLGIIDPTTPQVGNQNDLTTEQQLSAAFRTAAMSVTQLYKDSLKNSRRAFQEGYVQALQDFVAFIHSHPLAPSVNTPEGRDAARIPVGDLFEFANSRHAHISDTAVGRGSGSSDEGFAPPLSPNVAATQQTPQGNVTPQSAQPPQPPQPPSVTLNGLSLSDSSTQPTSHAAAGGMTGGGYVPIDSLKRRYMPPTFAPEMISFLGRPVNLSGDGTNNGCGSNPVFEFGLGNEPPPKKGRRE